MGIFSYTSILKMYFSLEKVKLLLINKEMIIYWSFKKLTAFS